MSIAEAAPSDTCPVCRHAKHDGRQCLNMSSDNGCSCDKRVVEAAPSDTDLDPADHSAMVLAWTRFYKPGMGDKEAQAFKAAFVAGLSRASQPVQVEATDESFERFIGSFNGDEAGDVDHMWAADGATGWAMRGGNDARAVFEKAVAALGGGE